MNAASCSGIREEADGRVTLAVELPHPARALSPNASSPLTARGAMAAARKKTRLKKLARTLAWAHTLQALNGRRMAPNRYLIRWRYKGTPPDDDNVIGSCKAFRDGACAALGINDRGLRLRDVEYVHDKARWKVMEMVFWSEDEGGGPEAAEGDDVSCVKSATKGDVVSVQKTGVIRGGNREKIEGKVEEREEFFA